VTTDAETIVRRAYHAAEGNVMDVQGFIDLFSRDGVINMGHSGQEFSGIADETYRGDQLGEIVVRVAKLIPDIHRELHRVNVLGNVVAVELSIQGTVNRPTETPAGDAQPTGAKVDVPTADFWYLSDGKIERFDCYMMLNTMRAQMGVS
jgi:ketosteroid isomerase-like protein